MDELIVSENSISEQNSLIKSFMMHMSATGRRPSTLRTYDSALRSMYDKMREFGPVPDLHDISPEYIIMLKDSLDINERSKKLYMTILGMFIRYHTGRDVVKECGILWNQQVPNRKFITAEEFKIMMANGNEKQRLVLILGAMCGLRRSEIAHIKLDDVCGKVLKVHGKGHGKEGKIAYIRISDAVLKAIEDYMPIRESILADGDHSEGNLIVTEAVTKRGYPATSSSIGSIIKSISGRSHVEMSPHPLRRLFATSLYDIGVDFNTLRLMMRHEDVRTTMECYIDPNPVKMDNAASALEKILI